MAQDASKDFLIIMSALKQRQASRRETCKLKAPRLTPCPPKLEEFLKLVNLVPLDKALPSLTNVEILSKQQAAHKELQIASALAAVFKRHEQRYARFLALCQVISDLQSEAFGEYIIRSKRILRAWVFARADGTTRTSTIRGDQISLAIDRYNEFRDGRGFLKGVMHLAASRRETKASDLVEGLRFFGSAYIDKNDGLHIELAPFVKSLLHDDVEISRIRKCANRNCQRIFWAGRIDQKCCPAPDGKPAGCGHAYRNQLYRDEKKRSEEKLRFGKAQPTEREKRKRVRDAIVQGLQTENAIAKETKLPLGEVSRLAIKLFDDGQVDFQTVEGELEYFATRAAKKGK